MKQITCPHCGDTYPDFDVAHVCSKGLYAPKLKPKMNERIKELAEQAGMIIGDASNFDMTKFMPKEVKFAELIVRECASLAYDGPGGILDHFGLEEHFGVEE